MPFVKNTSLRLSIVPSIRSPRVVPNGSLLLSVTHDFELFPDLFGLGNLCLEMEEAKEEVQRNRCVPNWLLRSLDLMG